MYIEIEAEVGARWREVWPIKKPQLPDGERAEPGCAMKYAIVFMVILPIIAPSF